MDSITAAICSKRKGKHGQKGARNVNYEGETWSLSTAKASTTFSPILSKEIIQSVSLLNQFFILLYELNISNFIKKLRSPLSIKDLRVGSVCFIHSGSQKYIGIAKKNK